MADLPTLVFPPAPGQQHTHTVVFLHGRGDNTRSFSRALGTWRGSKGRSLLDAFPTFRWVLPQAPQRPVASTAETMTTTTAIPSPIFSEPEVWPQWFDVWNVRDFSDREEVQLPGLREMVPAVRRLLTREADKLGGRWDRVLLAGISMGAATAVHTLFNLDTAPAALLAFCARCPFAGRGLADMRALLGVDGAPAGDDNTVLRRTPVLVEHCVDDPLVPIERGKALCDTLRGFGAQVEWREYTTGGHWFHEPDGLDDVVKFIEKAVLGKGKGNGGGPDGQSQGRG